jgi:hypothetical protein
MWSDNAVAFSKPLHLHIGSGRVRVKKRLDAFCRAARFIERFVVPLLDFAYEGACDSTLLK